jgi:hypothetical protein
MFHTECPPQRRLCQTGLRALAGGLRARFRRQARQERMDQRHLARASSGVLEIVRRRGGAIEGRWYTSAIRRRPLGRSTASVRSSAATIELLRPPATCRRDFPNTGAERSRRSPSQPLKRCPEDDVRARKKQDELCCEYPAGASSELVEQMPNSQQKGVSRSLCRRSRDPARSTPRSTPPPPATNC